MEPLIIRLRTGHETVRNSIVVRRVASDGDGVNANNNSCMGRGASARTRVVDENVPRLNVTGRGLFEPAGASPPLPGGKAVTKVLGTDLLLPARIPSAGCSAIEVGMATSNKALGDKVCAVTAVVSIPAGIAVAPV